jgi:glutamate mutase epsilon subunit
MDSIEFSATCKGFYVIQIDSGLNEDFIYYDGGTFSFNIPFGEKLKSYNPIAFQGDKHYVHARVATNNEIKIRKNLAQNTLDGHSNSTIFPHAFANVETR